MKANDPYSTGWAGSLTSLFFIAFTLVPTIAFAEAGIVDQSVDALYNLHDQLQQVVMKSVKGVGEAMQEGPQQQGDAPWSMDDLKKIRQRNADLVNLNNTLADQQQRLANVNAQLLSKLPPNDPRRAGLSAELKQVASQMPDTRQAVQTYTNKLADANAAIDRWNQRNDPAYVPPNKPVTTRAKPPEPVEPPNTDDNSGGGGGDNTDNGVDTLKKREAEKEAEARALGKQREAAVNKYLDDPNAANRAEAEDLKRKLDGMVDDLNQLRGQVDGIDGVSRPPIHVRSATAIAKARRQRLRMGNANPNGSETNQGSGGGGCGGGMSTGESEHHHNPDGSDASGGYQDVAPGGAGSGNAASGGSGSGHHAHHKTHNAGTTSSGQYQRSTGGGGRSATSSAQYQRSQTGTGQKKTNNTSVNSHHHNASNMNGANYQNMSQTQYPSQQQLQQRRRRRAH